MNDLLARRTILSSMPSNIEVTRNLISQQFFSNNFLMVSLQMLCKGKWYEAWHAA